MVVVFAIIVREISYPGGNIIGVFETRALAEEGVRRFLAVNIHTRTDGNIEVVEFAMNQVYVHGVDGCLKSCTELYPPKDPIVPSSMHSNRIDSSVLDWERYLDEMTDKVYYFNHKTQESRWDPPINPTVFGKGVTIDTSTERLMDALSIT